ncbi:MAG: family 10 glycosylhydrolase [Anaerolineae bacterium]|nr:family 10 glycosylhydrolase [Anaerolineae bacterium]
MLKNILIDRSRHKYTFIGTKSFVNLIKLFILFVITGLCLGCNPTIASNRSGQIQTEGSPHQLEQTQDLAISATQEIFEPEKRGQTVSQETVSPNLATLDEIMPTVAVGQLKQETRAIWARVGRQPLRGRNGQIGPQDIDELVAKVDAAHLNVILLAVYSGNVYFEPSHTRFSDEERLPSAADPAFAKAGYPDALSYLISIRDERLADNDQFNDFEVHAWFNINVGGRKEVVNGDYIDLRTEGMLNTIFPEFRLISGEYYTTNADEAYIDHEKSVLQQPRFRAYMTDLIAGVVEDYHVDGVHLDHIRTGGICFNDEPLDYDGTEYDYPGCQKDYEAWTLATRGRQHTLWDDTDGHRDIQDGGSGRVAAWQERNVELLVKSIHDEVKSVDPTTVISVASVRNDVSGLTALQQRDGQSAWKWLNEGLIDAVFMTAYTPDTESIVDKMQTFRNAIQDPQKKLLVFPGLATYDLDDKDIPWSGKIMEQSEALLLSHWSAGQPLEPPTRGIGWFLFRMLTEKDAETLASGPYAEPAVPFWGGEEQ